MTQARILDLMPPGSGGVHRDDVQRLLAVAYRRGQEEAARAGSPAPPSDTEAATLLEGMPTNWKLSWGTDDEAFDQWCVHEVIGLPDEPSCRLVGSGATPFAALLRAAAATGRG